MLELDRRKDNKWIFQKNVSSSNIIMAFIDALKVQNNEIDSERIKEELKNQGIYVGRSQRGSSNTMGVRLSQACFYMLGYRKNKSFIPSSTTQFLQRNADNINLGESFLVNLFSLQFPSPYSNTPDNFSIYIGRLIVKLLLDERIEQKLYIDEFVYYLPFLEKISSNDYEELIKEIIEYRKLSYDEKKELFESVDDYNSLFANCLHEIKYYFCSIFNGFKVFELVRDSNHNEGKCFAFKHGNGNTYRRDSIGRGNGPSGYVKLFDNLKDKAKILCDKYSAFEEPKSQANSISKEDWIRDLYEFDMLNYINDIKTDNKDNTVVISAIKDMIYQSKYGSNDGKTFEKSLQPIFELFRECSNVEIISGSGDTDLLCIMHDDNEALYKVNVDAKKSSRRLESVNASRIMAHIRKNNSKYCIIVAPKFARGVINTDICGYSIVTIEAEVLANYVLKECLNNNDGWADYSSIDDIIEENLGTDITKHVDKLIFDRFKIA